VSAESKSRGIRQDLVKSDKVRALSRQVDPLEKGLPSNIDAERFVLGSVLLDGSRFDEIAGLTVEDFTTQRHINIFRRMQDLQNRGENIDCVMVAEELKRHDELWHDGLSYLVSLDDGLPHIAHLDSYVRLLKEKADLRRTIFALQKTMNECFLQTASARDLLDAHTVQLESIRATLDRGQQRIARVEDLDPIFANRTPTEYLIEPELPAKAVVTLTGNSESGKTTLACAWARDVFRRGHAVLILDRDRNPRDRICDRLERLGINTDSESVWVWDCEQREPPPQPNHPIIVDWVKRIIAETGKAPLIIGDSLVCFFNEDEDENSASDMRRVIDRFKVLAALGCTVIVIHHNNRSGEARGSSDFGPAGDQAFSVKNVDRTGDRLLDVITLRVEKSRYALSGSFRYYYADGQMVRAGEPASADSGNEQNEQLVALLKANPGIGAEAFEKRAAEQDLKRESARKFLKEGESSGAINVKREGKKKLHFWNDSVAGDGH
jgi:KaiC/GvpD/RAD55 family RecA-like ATPase